MIAELYGGEEKIKRLYSRAIMEDGLSQRIYALLQKSMNERQPLLDAIACRFAENNFLSEKIGKKVTNAFAEGITLFGVLSTQVGESDGEWVDKYGVKYSADRRKLIWCTNWDLEDYSILNGVQVICDSAFYDCSSLQSIHIPNSVKSIGNNVFEACSSLRSIHIPNSVKSIGDNAFGVVPPYKVSIFRTTWQTLGITPFAGAHPYRMSIFGQREKHWRFYLFQVFLFAKHLYFEQCN